MDKTTFINRFSLATFMLMDFTKQLCYNDFSTNYLYLIVSNSSVPDEALTEKEISVLGTWNEHENHHLSMEKVVELLHHDNQVPVWIDMVVREARPNVTIIELLCCNRLRDDAELYENGDITPFRTKVTMPSVFYRIEVDGKIDVNWKIK